MCVCVLVFSDILTFLYVPYYKKLCFAYINCDFLLVSSFKLYKELSFAYIAYITNLLISSCAINMFGIY